MVSSRFRISVDNDVILHVNTPANGFWDYGNMWQYGDNIWKNGGRNAPFDQPVKVFVLVFRLTSLWRCV